MALINHIWSKSFNLSLWSKYNTIPWNTMAQLKKLWIENFSETEIEGLVSEIEYNQKVLLGSLSCYKERTIRTIQVTLAIPNILQMSRQQSTISHPSSTVPICRRRGQHCCSAELTSHAFHLATTFSSVFCSLYAVGKSPGKPSQGKKAILNLCGNCIVCSITC